MATNCPQLLKPRACRSALCLRAAVSNPVREMSCKIWEKMLHTLFKAESSSDSLVFATSTYQRLSAFFFPQALSTAELIWTRMNQNGDAQASLKNFEHGNALFCTRLHPLRTARACMPRFADQHSGLAVRLAFNPSLFSSCRVGCIIRRSCLVLPATPQLELLTS